MIRIFPRPPTSALTGLGAGYGRVFAQVTDISASISQPRTQEWLVIIPDKPGVLAHRIKVRPLHSPNFVRLHNEGYVSWAGPVFREACTRTVPGETEKRKFMGSVMIVNDTSRESIYDKLKSDPFIVEGIWDWEKADVLPFKTIERTP